MRFELLGIKWIRAQIVGDGAWRRHDDAHQIRGNVKGAGDSVS